MQWRRLPVTRGDTQRTSCCDGNPTAGGGRASASPEVADDDDGHQQGAEGDGVAHSVQDVEPLEEVLLRKKKEGLSALVCFLIWNHHQTESLAWWISDPIDPIDPSYGQRIISSAGELGKAPKTESFPPAVHF